MYKRMIKKILPSAWIDPYFDVELKQRETPLTDIEAAELWFAQADVNVKRATPLLGPEPTTWMLKRPYIPISETLFKSLLEAKPDYYQLPSGVIVTFGEANVAGDWRKATCLMPLTADATEVVLAWQ
ncbi:hypothetical protein [Ferrimonas marina]|uniref:Uncharacterized protein n=1 Tax=Ferrimonas marina TaxID=299255 RepID=A0A1M5U104_9GAMM|nr:hypothetical protein [Ferrimonas marina]SHH56540.1 hypothetical protein SAMN02745129_2356 [Ferrimonas marina]